MTYRHIVLIDLDLLSAWRWAGSRWARLSDTLACTDQKDA